MSNCVEHAGSLFDAPVACIVNPVGIIIHAVTENQKTQAIVPRGSHENQ